MFFRFPHRGTWQYGLTLCRLTPFLQTTAVSVSVLSMLAICVNRYFAVHAPILVKVHFSKRRVRLTITAVWVLALASATPHLVVRTLVKVNNGADDVNKSPGIPDEHTPEVTPTYRCVQEWSNPIFKTVYNVVLFLEIFIVPLVLMTMLYYRVSATLWSNSSVSSLLVKQHFQHSSVTRLLAGRRKTVKNVIVLVAFFALSWLPYYVVNAWLEFNSQSDNARFVVGNILPLAQFAALSNAWVNPILYCFLSSSFRRSFRTLMCKWSCSPCSQALQSAGWRKYSGPSLTPWNTIDTVSV